MSINVGQLFVNHDNFKLMVRVVAEYMRIWQKGVFSRLSGLEKEEQGAENFLTRRSRRLTILPPRDGWAMIVEQVRFLADGDLARHVSESLGCRVVWVEVQGGALGWACFEFEKGQLVRGLLEPKAGREERLVAAANEAKAVSLSAAESADMPVYPTDPEMDAWNHLCSLGLPRSYIFTYPGDVLRLGSGGDLEAGFVILKDSHYGGRLSASVGPARFLPRPEGLPYRPDLVARESGQPTAIHEVRLLHGHPTRGGIETAFAAELNWRRRAFHVMSDTLSGNVPAVLFRYKDPADPDRDIEELIEKRREGCSSPFLYLTSGSGTAARRGFAAAAAAALNAGEPALEAAPDESGHLAVKIGGEGFSVDVIPAYRRYLADPGALEAAAAEALEGARARHALIGSLGSADAAGLCLVVRPTGWLLPESVSVPLGDGSISAVLAAERDGLLVEVPAAALQGLGLSSEQALERARSRLADLAAGVRISAGAGSVGRLEVDAPLPASSLLAWPELAAKLTAEAGGEVVVAAPAAGVLLFAPASAPPGELRAATADEYDSAARPVSDALYRPGAEGPVLA